MKNNYWSPMEREFEKDLAMDKSFENRMSSISKHTIKAYVQWC